VISVNQVIQIVLFFFTILVQILVSSNRLAKWSENDKRASHRPPYEYPSILSDRSYIQSGIFCKLRRKIFRKFNDRQQISKEHFISLLLLLLLLLKSFVALYNDFSFIAP